MLRRNLLAATAASVFPLSKALAICPIGTPIIEGGGSYGAGSSVSPLGTARTERTAADRPRAGGASTQCGGYGPTGAYPTWPTTPEFYQLLATYSVGVAAKPFPGHWPVSSKEEVASIMGLGSNEYMDLSDVIDVATGISLTGGVAVGAMFRGGRTGAIAGAVFTVAMTTLVVAVHTTNSFINIRANSGAGPDPSLFYVNGQLSAWVPNPGGFASQMPVPSIPFPGGGGGGGFVIPTYLLL
jgi:hypothetical protein